MATSRTLHILAPDSLTPSNPISPEKTQSVANHQLRPNKTHRSMPPLTTTPGKLKNKNKWQIGWLTNTSTVNTITHCLPTGQTMLKTWTEMLKARRITNLPWIWTLTWEVVTPMWAHQAGHPTFQLEAKIIRHLQQTNKLRLCLLPILPLSARSPNLWLNSSFPALLIQLLRRLHPDSNLKHLKNPPKVK